MTISNSPAIQIGQVDKLFTLAEAKLLFPLLYKLTKQYYDKLQPVQQRMDQMLSNDPRRGIIEHDYQQVVGQWKAKVEKLGAQVNGLWVIEFDMGEGYLSWRYPELSLVFFRPQGANFIQRVTLSSYINEHDPDWAY